MLATTIHTGDAAVVFLAERLGQLRELTDTESRILQRALNRDRGLFRRWTAQEDAMLLKASKARIRVSEIAETLRRTEDAVYRRLCDLRKREKVR